MTALPSEREARPFAYDVHVAACGSLRTTVRGTATTLRPSGGLWHFCYTTLFNQRPVRYCCRHESRRRRK